MNDFTNERPLSAPPFPQDRLRVEATYPASDGSTPESIVVEVNDGHVTGELVAEIITSLATVPGMTRPIRASLVDAELTNSTSMMDGGAR